MTRRGFGLEVDTVACFVGRLEREKGLSLLLNALARVGSNVGLVIVGSGSCGERVKSLASELGIAHRVRTIGWVSQRDLPAYYQACDFLVLPTVSTPLVRETWGLVANEAMMGGLPVLASDAVGAAAGGLVEDDVTGLVVPERDIGALAVALTKLSSDSALRRRLGVAARERAETFTFESAAETFTEAIQHAVTSRRRC
jgi:glycosyltransferase involved in cell wall biosynthesis